MGKHSLSRKPTTTVGPVTPKKTYQITDVTFGYVPNGSSIVTATVRCRDSKWFLDPAALSHRVVGNEGKVVHIGRLSPDSWMLVGYRYDDATSGLWTLNADRISSSCSDAADHATEHSDDGWDEENENEEEGIENYS